MEKKSKMCSLANAKVRLWYMERNSLLLFVLAEIAPADTITILSACKAKLQLHIVLKLQG